MRHNLSIWELEIFTIRPFESTEYCIQQSFLGSPWSTLNAYIHKLTRGIRENVESQHDDKTVLIHH